MPETMKLFGSTKKLIGKTKNGENVPSLEVVEVVLVQYSLVDNQYQQKSEVLHTFTFLLVFENTELNEIIITFTDQNERPLEIEDKVNLTLLINK